MAKKKRLVPDFYELKVSQIMDKRVWDLPFIEEDEDIHHVLNILAGRSHIWVVKTRKDCELAGVITEHDVLSILAPKKLPAYGIGMPDIRSFHHGTAQTAGDIMKSKIVSCNCDDKVKDVLTKMTKFQLRRLPIVDGTKIIGELTLHQLIHKFYRATQYYPITEDEEG